MFNDIDWQTVAQFMDATLVHHDRERRVVTMLRKWKPGVGAELLEVHDNGGEVNVHKVVPRLDFSMPYDASDNPGPATLGVRLHQALVGGYGAVEWGTDFDALVR